MDLRRGKSASVLPLFTGLISKEKARRLVEEHVLSDEVFWTPCPLSFVSRASITELNVQVRLRRIIATADVAGTEDGEASVFSSCLSTEVFLLAG